MPANPQRDFARQAKFIFRGTVQRLRASNMAAAPANLRTLVVRIEEIFTSPPVLTPFVGRDITVQFKSRPKLHVGESAIFHTNGWLFGETIAVRALAAGPVHRVRAVASRRRARSTASPTADPVQNLKLQ